MLWSARYQRICVGETSVVFQWKCSTIASNLKMRMEEEVRVLDLDKEAFLPAAGTLLAPVGQHQFLTRATLVMTPLQTWEEEAEAERPRQIVSAPVTDL